MAEMNIEFSSAIHAEIIIDSSTLLSNTPIIVDPLTNSYSDFGNLVYYYLEVTEENNVYNTVLLQNGKNSRLTTSGQGNIVIKLTIEDDKGNTATDFKVINVI